MKLKCANFAKDEKYNFESFNLLKYLKYHISRVFVTLEMREKKLWNNLFTNCYALAASIFAISSIPIPIFFKIPQSKFTCAYE